MFDRVRENMQLHRGRPLKFEDLIDLSINGTLSRTLLTSVTTLFVVLVLLVFGGPVIRDFAFALLVGIIIGTYSSIFVASPMLAIIQNILSRFIKETEDEGGQREDSFRGKGKKSKKKQQQAGETAEGSGASA